MNEDQESVLCTVTQASNNEETDPEFVQKIVEARMDLPPGRPRGSPIEVTYSYDANQRMICVFRDVVSGRKKEFNLDLADAARRNADGSKSPDALEAELQDLVIQ